MLNIFHTNNAIKFVGFLCLSLLLIACKDDKTDDLNESEPHPRFQESTTGITTFAPENIYSRNTYLRSNNAMQSFTIDDDGVIWYLQSGENNDRQRHQLNLIKTYPNKYTAIHYEDDGMILEYFGHGTNADVEKIGDDAYLWLGAFGSANSSGQYWTEKLIGRVKYEKGKTKKTNECQEYYYIGEYTDLHPAIDAENDVLTINYADPANSSFRCFVMYKLSEAKNASQTIIPIECTDGFLHNNPRSTNKIIYNQLCRDLTTISPIARVKFLKSGYGGAKATYYSWQGFDIYKSKLYYFEGQSNYNLKTPLSYAYLTIFDFKSKIIEERTQVKFISDLNLLKEIGVSYWGAMEAEGVKLHKDELYLGFTARGLTSEDTRHYHNIFVFKASIK